MDSKPTLQISKSDYGYPEARFGAEDLQSYVRLYLPKARTEIDRQLRSLGLDQFETDRFLSLSEQVLQDLVAGLDARAFASTDVAEQTSMLLSRADIDILFHATAIGRAMLQSAIAVLVLDFVLFISTWRNQPQS